MPNAARTMSLLLAALSLAACGAARGQGAPGARPGPPGSSDRDRSAAASSSAIVEAKPPRATSLSTTTIAAGAPTPPGATAKGSYLLRPARIFDGESARPHEGWVALVRGERIEAIGPEG